MPTETAVRFAIEVQHPLRGWIRLGGRYSSKAVARTWYPFIKGAWHGLPVRTVKVANRGKREAPCR